ncbi:hypothetical protein DV735_g4619, partial [Chaetothyriales sp. CBS 134920]
MEQFLLLRILHDDGDADDLLQACATGKHLVAAKTWEEATTFLGRLKSWKEYLASIDNGSQHEGIFTVVRHYQLSTLQKAGDPIEYEEDPTQQKVIFTPRPVRKTNNPFASSNRPAPVTPTPGSRHQRKQDSASISDLDTAMGNLEMTTPDTTEAEARTPSPLEQISPAQDDNPNKEKAVEDEQIVNIALLIFLNAITVPYTKGTNEWSPYRCPFVVKDAGGNKVYEARVDGLLRDKATRTQTKALVEVKPHPRRDTTRMQEAAQMAAWISNYPPPGYEQDPKEVYKRLLVSQDKQMIYVSIASFDAEYVKYIQGKPTSTTSLLSMIEYGPFDVGIKRHMEALGFIMRSFSIQGEVL